MRVHPILQLDERDVWDVSWFHMVPEVTGIEIEEYPEDEDDLPKGLSKDDDTDQSKVLGRFQKLRI